VATDDLGEYTDVFGLSPADYSRVLGERIVASRPSAGRRLMRGVNAGDVCAWPVEHDRPAQRRRIRPHTIGRDEVNIALVPVQRLPRSRALAVKTARDSR